MTGKWSSLGPEIPSKGGTHPSGFKKAVVKKKSGRGKIRNQVRVFAETSRRGQEKVGRSMVGWKKSGNYEFLKVNNKKKDVFRGYGEKSERLEIAQKEARAGSVVPD